MSVNSDAEQLAKITNQLAELSKRYRNYSQLSATLQTARQLTYNCAIDLIYGKEVDGNDN